MIMKDEYYVYNKNINSTIKTNILYNTFVDFYFFYLFIGMLCSIVYQFTNDNCF